MKKPRLSLFIWLCIALHIAALAVLLLFPAQWIAVLIFLLALHGVITAAGLLPTSALLGSNIRRLPKQAAARNEIAITIDDGPDPEVTPQVLTILREHNVSATFFCIGERAHANPELCKEIVAAGHDIENHGQRHRKHTSLFGPRGWRQEVGEAQTTFEILTGRRPQFFRPIAGLRNPFLDPLLQQLGLQLVSWTRRAYDTRLADPARIFDRLTRKLRGGDIVLLHDGNAARSADGRPVILNVLPRLLTELSARNFKAVTLSEAFESNRVSKADQACRSV